MFSSKYLSILLILFLLISCKIRNQSVEHSDNMTIMLDTKEVYATGIPQRVREILNYYYNLDLSIEKNQKEVEDFEEFIYLFKEKFIATYLKSYKFYKGCGKSTYAMDINFNPNHPEILNIILSKTKNGYKLCKISKINLLDNERKWFKPYLKKFNKKYWI